jgi:hypothetical protein
VRQFLTTVEVVGDAFDHLGEGAGTLAAHRSP